LESMGILKAEPRGKSVCGYLARENAVVVMDAVGTGNMTQNAGKTWESVTASHTKNTVTTHLDMQTHVPIVIGVKC
jgi:hypothetical protein